MSCSANSLVLPSHSNLASRMGQLQVNEEIRRCCSETKPIPEPAHPEIEAPEHTDSQKPPLEAPQRQENTNHSQQDLSQVPAPYTAVQQQIVYPVYVDEMGNHIQPYPYAMEHGQLYHNMLWPNTLPGYPNPYSLQNMPGLTPNAVGAVSGSYQQGSWPVHYREHVHPYNMDNYVHCNFTPSDSVLTVVNTPSNRDFATRTIKISGLPSSVDHELVKDDLESWGAIRHIDLSCLPQGAAVVTYFDLRHSMQAFADIQRQLALRHQKVSQLAVQQQQLQLNSPTAQTQRAIAKAGVTEKPGSTAGNGSLSEENPSSKRESSNGESSSHPLPPGGLISGAASWVEYMAPSIASNDEFGAENQGTLVIFNLPNDVPLSDLQATFGAYGTVKEVREAPLKKQHKFVEYFDVRHSNKALSELNGTVMAGRRVKIEFSRTGGHARRAKDYGSHGFLPNPLWVPPPGQQQQQQQMHYSPAEIHGYHYQAVYPQTIPPWSDGGGKQGAAPPGTPANNPRQQGGFQSPALSSNQNWSGPEGGAYRQAVGGQEKGGKMGNGVKTECRNGGIREERDRQNGRLNGGFPNSRYHGEQQQQQQRALSPHDSSSNSTALYMFSEADVLAHKEDARTTVMIRNIPNKYSQDMLLSLLDAHCVRCNASLSSANTATAANSSNSDSSEGDSSEGDSSAGQAADQLSAYDFVYLPIDFKNRCNLGYAFVNFTSAIATLKLYKAFHCHQWEAFNSRKVCQVTYARVQGRAALEEHFRNSRFACNTDEFLPLVFHPPRNGIVCTQPFVAAGFQAGRRSLHLSPPPTKALLAPLLSSSSQSATAVGSSSGTTAEQGGDTSGDDSSRSVVGNGSKAAEHCN